MRLLIDANVLLDVLQNRQPHAEDSSKVWKLCETEQAEGYISALTIANLMYIMRRQLEPDAIEHILQSLSLIFRMADLCVADIAHAASMKWDDFEDAVQASTAERIHADYIITRNVRDFKKSRIIAFTPSEFLARL